MPRSKTIETLSAVDLAYAVRRLIAMRKTAENQVLKLASERLERIAAVQAELKVLTAGGAVAAVTPAAKAVRQVARKVRKVARKAAPAKPSTAPSGFRQLQGKYMGLLRNFAGPVRDRIKAIAKKQKLPAAIAEMTKLLAGTSTSKKVTSKPASATKPARKSPAGRKLHLSPERKVQLKVQGTYFGLMRGVPDAEKAKIKAISKDKGMKAAIEVMKKLPGRK